MFSYSKLVIGITALAATILPTITFSSPARADSRNGVPDLIIKKSGDAAQYAVFISRKTTFGLGCPAIRNMWNKVPTTEMSSRGFNTILANNPLAAVLPCDGSAKAYKTSDEGPGLVLIKDLNGVPHRHYVSSPEFAKALRAGNFAVVNGSSFRSKYPRRGTDFVAYEKPKPKPKPVQQSTNLQKPRASGIIENIVNGVPIPNGRVDAHGRLYYNGSLMGIIGVFATQNNSGAHGSVIMVGVDGIGNQLFVKKLDAPTACGKWDITCPSEVKTTKFYQVNPKIAPYVKKIDLIVTTKDRAKTRWERIRDTIKEAVETYNTLPPEVKAAIASQTGSSL